MKLDLTKLTIDTEDGEWLQFNQTGIRDSWDESTVDQYAEAMLEGAVFPPIIVYSDGENYFLADGFHRVLAAEKLEWREIDAEVRAGGRQDAIWYALAANNIHGLRMSRADVRRAIELALREFPSRSNREIARQIGCGDQLVGEVRAKLELNCVIHAVEKTVGADGKLRPAKRTAKPVSVVKPDATPSDVANIGEGGYFSAEAAHQAVEVTVIDSPEQLPEAAPKPVGLDLARQALDILRSIPMNDEDRPQAIALVSDWLNEECSPTAANGKGAL